jgi:1,4-alpha-glucan branching enzyme
MPGDDWQKFANLRLLLGYMYAQPGKKLLFMGSEIGQWREWNHGASLDWSLLEHERHLGILRWTEDINRVYTNEAAMHLDTEPTCFEWIDGSDADGSIISFLRKGSHPNGEILIVCNFTPVPRPGYRVGVPRDGYWKELLNSDAKEYWGRGVGNAGGVYAESIASHGRSHSLNLQLPPLAIVYFKHIA